MQASYCTGLGAAQLELQQAGEQVVIPEPGARGVQRQHERVRLFQVLQQPLRATAPAEKVSQLAVDPLEDAGTQQQAEPSAPSRRLRSWMRVSSSRLRYWASSSQFCGPGIWPSRTASASAASAALICASVSPACWHTRIMATLHSTSPR